MSVESLLAERNALRSVVRKLQAPWEAPIDEWDQLKWADPDDTDGDNYDWSDAERVAIRAALAETES